MRRVYLDHAATTPVRREVVDAMLPLLQETYGNPSSLHRHGREARRALEDARESIARILGAGTREIVFTSGGTEADNLALAGVARAHRHKGKHLVVSRIEHHAVLTTAERLEGEGFEVTKVGVDRHGRVDPDEIDRAIRPDTVLVSVMYANNEVGTVQPVADIAAVARARGVLVHTDAVQGAGKLALDVRALGIDLLSLSAHKIHGPKGAGLLYVRRGVKLAPLLSGGEHEFGKRAGTENVPGLVGFARALELAEREREAEAVRQSALRDRLERLLADGIPGVSVNGREAPGRLPGILSCCFEGIRGEGIILHLDQDGVSVSPGSACTSGSQEPSHVLAALGVPPGLAGSATRFSLGLSTTGDDVEYAAACTIRAVQRLRSLAAAK